MSYRDERPFTWDRDFRISSDGHRFVRCVEVDHPMEGRWAVQDQSGEAPWLCEDGVLWLVETQPILFGRRGITACVSVYNWVLGQETANGSTPMDPEEAIGVAWRLRVPIVTANGSERFRVISQEYFDGLTRQPL